MYWEWQYVIYAMCDRLDKVFITICSQLGANLHSCIYDARPCMVPLMQYPVHNTHSYWKIIVDSYSTSG